MKSKIVAIVVAFGLSFTAAADLITIEVTGTVDNIFGTTSTFSTGDSVMYTLTLDDASPLIVDNVSSYADNVVASSGSIGGYNFELATHFAAEVTLANGPLGEDAASILYSVSGPDMEGLSPSFLFMNFRDPTDTVFTGGLGPGGYESPLLEDISDWNAFSIGGGGFGFADGIDEDARTLGIEWSIDNVRFVDSVVPEPATMTLLGLGLGALAYRRRKLSR